jgi:hypothetical protein
MLGVMEKSSGPACSHESKRPRSIIGHLIRLDKLSVMKQKDKPEGSLPNTR